jgi:hypothetical protein
MRFKSGILLTLISIVAMLACDKLYDEPSNSGVVHDDAPGCNEQDVGPHPYFSCVEPIEDLSNIDPACVLGCGYVGTSDEVGHTVCGIPCEDDLDCGAWDPGGSVTACDDGRCYWYCDDEHACPSELECVSRGDLGPGEAPFWGECWASNS